MEAEVKRALAHQAETFMQSELYKYLKGALRADAINVFVMAKATDEETQKQAKYLLGVLDLFDRKLATLAEQLAFERADEKRRAKKPKS